MSRDSSSSSFEPVKRALGALLNASSESRFRAAAVGFAENLCRALGGEQLLTEHGEYVLRHTGPTTAFAAAWERARKHLGPDVTPILRRQDPQWVSVGELADVSDAIDRLLEDDTSLRVDSLSLVDPDDAETQDQRIDRFLTDQAREALEGLQSAADELVAELETWPSDGCRYLLQIH